VGRLVNDKGINELVKAFDKICQEFDFVKLLLVGSKEEDLDPLSTETISIINSNNYIIETGYQEDVRPFLAISDVLTFPSYREGFPNVVLQAGAMELPSIVTDINGCNEIVTNAINGDIIPSKNVEELYKAMKTYLTDKEKCDRLKVNTRKIIEKKYQRIEFQKLLLNEYQSTEKKLILQ
jgi:glycosyltransferase involved in cell wall biosynthesis